MALVTGRRSASCYRAGLVLAALTDDRASLSDSARPYELRPGKVTDQDQPRRGPRHHTLTRPRRMRPIVAGHGPPEQPVPLRSDPWEAE